MGQYHMLVNFDKREFVNPHKLGNGLKLMEQIGWDYSFAPVIHMLIAGSSGRGGGDYPTGGVFDEVIGRWAGDRIAMVGDYTELGDYNLTEFELRTMLEGVWGRKKDSDKKVYRDARGRFTKNSVLTYVDISDKVAVVFGKVFEVEFTGTGWKDVKKVRPQVKPVKPRTLHKIVTDSSLIVMVHFAEYVDNKLGESEGELTLTFKNGKMYTYTDVPYSVALDLIESESKGRFYNQHIKHAYYTL